MTITPIQTVLSYPHQMPCYQDTQRTPCQQLLVCEGRYGKPLPLPHDKIWERAYIETKLILWRISAPILEHEDRIYTCHVLRYCNYLYSVTFLGKGSCIRFPTVLLVNKIFNKPQVTNKSILPATLLFVQNDSCNNANVFHDTTDNQVIAGKQVWMQVSLHPAMFL